MEVRQARYFLAIVDHQSMSRAAEALYITQPALSQALHQLERGLRSQLFERNSRGMHPTEEGRALLEPARRLVEASRVATVSVQMNREHLSGNLVVASTRAFAVQLSQWVARFRKLHPGVDFNLVPLPGNEAIETIIDRTEVDLVFAHDVGDVQSDITKVPMGRDELVLAVPADDDPFDDVIVHILELSGRPLIISPPNSSMRVVVTEAFARAGIEPTIGVETNFVDTFLPLTANGAGWSIISRRHIEVAGAHRIHVHLLEPPPFRSYSFYYRERDAPKAVHQFLRLAKVFPAQ